MIFGLWLKLIFLIVTRAVSLVGLSRREWWKDAEILMLRHQLAVAQRERPRAHSRLTWPDRAWLALLARTVPTDRPSMVLKLTAAGAVEDRVSGLGLGADDYLAKPFHFTELVLASARSPAVSPPPGPASCTRRASNSTPQRHSATRDGRPLDLSVKEFAVLEALMRASPAFLTAEDLLE
jgi:CheY-like chemotaxis protein